MSNESVSELTRQSGFVFKGTVRRVGAVASSGSSSGPNTAVVIVDKIFKGPESLSHFAGREIALTFDARAELAPERSAVFFTVGYQYGAGLAVREVGRIDAADAGLERTVHRTMTEADDDALLERLQTASLVVTGVVVRVAPAERRARVGSEHDPDWWTCVIAVESVEKGSVKAEKSKGSATHVTAFFAHSEDVAWYRSPKVHEGDSRVFLLHDTTKRPHPAPGPAVVHPLDVRPAASAERVRALLAREPE